MKVVSPNQTLQVAVERGRNTIGLRSGERYVMHDVEAAGGQNAGVFPRANQLPDLPKPFGTACGGKGRLIVPFIGGLGDAISMLPVLGSIQRQMPKLTIDITTTSGPAEVFEFCPVVQQIRPYPMPVRMWKTYQHYLSMELVNETNQQPGRPLPEVFADAIGLELVDPSFPFELPETTEDASEITKPVPLVGIAVGDGPTDRAYPHGRLLELLSELVGRGFGCVLFGLADEQHWSIPTMADGAATPIIDMRSQTNSVLELAAWLRAMDVVVAHDSFIMHLAGALGRPLVGLFAPTSPTHVSPYASGTSIASAEMCSPCHEATGACPKGHGHCVAWEDDGLSPAMIAHAVDARLRGTIRLSLAG